MPPSTPGRLAPGMIATYISSHRDGADVRRQEPVQRDARGVGGQDLQVRDAPAGIGGVQDRVPGERGQRGLAGLQRPAREQVADPDRAQRVPEVREPAAGRRRRAGRGRRARPRCPPATPAPWRGAADASGRRTAAIARTWVGCGAGVVTVTRARLAARQDDPASPHGRNCASSAPVTVWDASVADRPCAPPRPRPPGRRRPGARGARRRCSR